MRLSQRFKTAAARHSPNRSPRVTRYGRVPLLVSVCHATPHLRDGRTKQAEAQTGALALTLAREMRATVIVPASFQDQDPNFDPRGRYKTLFWNRPPGGFVLFWRWTFTACATTGARTSASVWETTVSYPVFPTGSCVPCWVEA